MFGKDQVPRESLDKVKHELNMLYEISNAIRTTLDLNQILYIILTALTSREGLGFNRAMLFLVNERDNILEGKMGIGPHTGEEADKIWKGIEDQRLTLEDLVNSYHSFRKDPESKLNNIVKGIKIPIREDTGILSLTILEGMPFEVTTEETRKRVSLEVQHNLNTEYFVTVPLKTKDKILGAILVDNIFTKKPITKSDIRILNMFANHAGLAIENSRLYEEKVHLSKIDWLTKLWNSGQFHKILAGEVEKAKASEMPLSLLMIDVDNFKPFNDSFGHQKGDAALAEIAKILNDKSRTGDNVARYGGEEFSTIMPNTKKEDAKFIAERLRLEVEKNYSEKKGKARLTISIGIAAFPADAGNKDDLILKADNALYEAKKLGKNRTCLYHSKLKKLFLPFDKKK